MKNALINIFLLGILTIPSLGQKYDSDLTCMIRLQSWETINCDTSNRWEIERSYDIIMKHWIYKDAALLYNFRKQTLTQISEGNTYDNYPSKNEVIEGFATDGIKNFSLVINGQYVDRDGEWDQFRLNWFEPNAYAKRTMFCTILDSIGLDIPSQ